jgi:selenocysteine lyase/cysteine desulfurase
MAQAAANIPLKATQTIVTLAEQFPSNVYPWMDLAQRTGARFVTVPRPADDDWTAALLATIDPSTGVVAVPNCHWTDGGLIDLVAVGAACRRVGAVLCIDGAQSVGALPFDVKRIDPDYLVVPCYKWLLGPYSFGFLYVAPRHQGGRPIEHNWIARLIPRTSRVSSTTNRNSRLAHAGSTSASAAISRSCRWRKPRSS